MCNVFGFLKRKNKNRQLGVEHEEMKFTGISWMELLSLPEEKSRKKIRKNLDKYYKKITKMNLDDIKTLREEIFNATKYQPIPTSLEGLFPMDKVEIAKSELIKLVHTLDEEINKRNAGKG